MLPQAHSSLLRVATRDKLAVRSSSAQTYQTMPTPTSTQPETAISPEAALLLACARTAPDTAEAEQIRALAGQALDWDAVVLLAHRHRLTPLLYTNLQALCPDLVPLATLQELRDSYRASAKPGLLLTGELLRCLALLRAHDIPALPFKGPALAVLAYGNLSLRPCDDLDILVREHDVPRAKQLLIAAGYTPEMGLSGAREAAFLQSQYEYHFERDDGRVCIGLHFRVRPRHFGFPLTPQALWDRRAPMELCGQTIDRMALEDQLLALCAHGTYHAWEKISWVCDIAQLLRGADPDWPALLARADALGGARMLGLGLLLAHDLLGVPLPAPIAAELHAGRALARLASQVRAGMFDLEAEPASVASAGLFHLRARERVRDRIRYCALLALLPTAEDWALLPLPARLAWGYSLIRPLRLAGTYGAGLLPRRRG
jgi:hypothetical protein